MVSPERRMRSDMGGLKPLFLAPIQPEASGRHMQERAFQRKPILESPCLADVTSASSSA